MTEKPWNSGSRITGFQELKKAAFSGLGGTPVSKRRQIGDSKG